MPTQDIRKQVALALEAVNNKKAEDVALLQLPGESSTFTDYFLICSGSNPRQVQAIADEVDERLSKDMGVEPNAREGYQTAEWILLDYVDFVVHIFNAQRRAYYDLERLWKSAHKLTAEELLEPAAAAPVESAPELEVPRAKKRAKEGSGEEGTQRASSGEAERSWGRSEKGSSTQSGGQEDNGEEGGGKEIRRQESGREGGYEKSGSEKNCGEKDSRETKVREQDEPARAKAARAVVCLKARFP